MVLLGPSEVGSCYAMDKRKANVMFYWAPCSQTKTLMCNSANFSGEYLGERVFEI